MTDKVKVRRCDVVKYKVMRIEENYQNMTFSAVLRSLRTAHGITRKEVMNDIGVDHMHLFYLERGLKNRSIFMDEVQKLAYYYGFPEIILLEKAEKAKPTLRRFERIVKEHTSFDQGEHKNYKTGFESFHKK